MQDIIIKSNRYYRFEASGWKGDRAAAQAAADKWVTDTYFEGQCIFDAERALEAAAAVGAGGEIAVSIMQWSYQWTTLKIGEASLRLIATSKEPLTPRAKLSRSDFLRGEDERYVVDSYLGDGAYDSEFTTAAQIDEALEKGGM
jgi:hypothetical protein